MTEPVFDPRVGIRFIPHTVAYIVGSCETVANLALTEGRAADEIRASGQVFVVHALSMAGNGVDCKWLWSVCQVSQRERSEQLDLVEDLRLTDQHAVDLGCLVSLTLAQLLTPEQLTHGLVTQSERHVVQLDAFGHVSHQWTYVVWHVVAPC